MTLSGKHKGRKKKHMAKVYNRMSELHKSTIECLSTQVYNRMSELHKNSLHYHFSVSMNIKLHSNFRIFTITQSTCHTSLVT